MENCVFYANIASSGGVLFLLMDEDNAESDGAGIVSFDRCGNDEVI